MNRMKEGPKEEGGMSPYHAKLEKWTSKELQLNMLHEEIVHKREALLRSCGSDLLGVKGERMPTNTEAAVRGDKLMQDMDALEEEMKESLSMVKEPRFSFLQSNYWSMVQNMFPIWEKSLQEAQQREDRTSSERAATLSSLAHV